MLTASLKPDLALAPAAACSPCATNRPKLRSWAESSTAQRRRAETAVSRRGVRDLRQRHGGWMLSIVEDCLRRGASDGVCSKRRAGVGVRRELRIVAARDLQADAVTCSVFVTRWPDLDLVLVGATRCSRGGLGKRVPERSTQN